MSVASIDTMRLFPDDQATVLLSLTITTPSGTPIDLAHGEFPAWAVACLAEDDRGLWKFDVQRAGSRVFIRNIGYEAPLHGIH